MTALPWVFDDGGRAESGRRGLADDCVTRAIAIATGMPYTQVYEFVFDELRAHAARQPRLRGKVSPREGVPKKVSRKLMDAIGWEWTPTMGIGTGTTVHLAQGELPPGRLVVAVSRHLCAVIDGVVHDTHDPTRDGTRAVYGYWRKP